MSEVLHASHVRRRYGRLLAVDIERLAVEQGEVLAILGPNGSGKSTLFRLLLQLEKPDAGTIRFSGGRMAGVFQQPFLFAGTVRDNIGFGVSDKSKRADRVAAAAQALCIEPLLPVNVKHLSGGEAQRVALARAIALQPDLLLLDEPTSNLDVLVRKSFRSDIEHVARHHAGAVILITHDPAEAFSLADRVAVMEDGRIVQSGTPEELLNEPRTPFVASFVGAELLLDGRVSAVADELVQVDAGAATIWAISAADGSYRPRVDDCVHVSYRPEDVMLSVGEPLPEVSARNQFRLRISSLNAAGALVRIQLDGGLRLYTLLTRTSVEALGLRPGVEVIAHIKATALHVMRSGK